MSIWSDSTISAFAEEAEYEIATELNCITKRVALEVVALTSVYEVPTDVISIRRVTWLGKKLEPLAFHSLLKYPVIGPAGFLPAFLVSAFSTAFMIGSSDSKPESGSPYAYFYSGFGENVIKLFPTPSVSLSATTTNLFGTSIATACIIEYYTFPDVTANTYRLPQYVARRIIKSFVLSKLLAMEGAGQDLIGSMRHRKRFEKLMQDFRVINNGVFVSRMKTRSPSGSAFATKISRPRLPSNFGTFSED